eukprot:6178073-Pleurochrysis_carterae.AAC.1
MDGAPGLFDQAPRMCRSRSENPAKNVNVNYESDTVVPFEFTMIRDSERHSQQPWRFAESCARHHVPTPRVL